MADPFAFDAIRGGRGGASAQGAGGGMGSGHSGGPIQPSPGLALRGQNNWGRPENITDNQREELARVQLLDWSGYIAVSGEARQIQNVAGGTIYYPMAEVVWGNGNTSFRTIIDLSGHWDQVFVASTIKVIGYWADINGNPPPAGSGVTGQFAIQVGLGLTQSTQQSTQFQPESPLGGRNADQLFPANGIAQQGRLFSIRGSSNTGVQAWLWVFDSIGGATGKVLDIIGVPAQGDFERTYPNTKSFFNGVFYALSSSPTAFVSLLNGQFSAQAEIRTVSPNNT